MQRRTARTIQRLTLAAGLCLGAWAAAEYATQHAARADDVVPASTELGTVEVGTAAAADAVAEVLPAPSRTPSTPPPATNRPVRDAIDDVEDVATPTAPPTPEPAVEDGSSPQHPADLPPAPADPPADDKPEPAVEPTGPADATGEPAPAPEPPAVAVPTVPFGGAPPSRWTPGLETDQADEPLCRPSDHTPVHYHRTATIPRGRADDPPRQPGSGPLPIRPCQPDGPAADQVTPPLQGKPVEQCPACEAASGVVITVELHDLGPPGGGNTMPASREDPWPPGPG